MPTKKKAVRPFDEPLRELDDQLLKEQDRSYLRKLVDSGLAVLDANNKIGKFALPKETLHLIVNSLDKMKTEIVILIGNEVKEFLNASNMSEEIVKAMSQLEIEVKADIKFKTAGEKKKTAKGKAVITKNKIKAKIKVDK